MRELVVGSRREVVDGRYEGGACGSFQVTNRADCTWLINSYLRH